MECDTSVNVVIVGETWVERADDYRTPAAYARPRAYQRPGKLDLWRLEIPEGAILDDDLLVPISGKRKLRKLRAAIDAALRKPVGDVIKLMELPRPRPTPVAPVMKPARPPAKPAAQPKPKPKHPRFTPHPIVNGTRVCASCGAAKALSDYYRRSSGTYHVRCKPCHNARYGRGAH